MTSAREAAQARAAATATPSDRPSQRRQGDSEDSPRNRAPAQVRIVLDTEETRAAGATGSVDVRGYASTYEQPYEMYDAFGPYLEVVTAGAAELTLAANPLVQLVLNHGGVPLASTGSGTLQLSEDTTGLLVTAGMDTRMPSVQDVKYAMERGDLTEMSFKFHITRGMWSPDYTEYRIESFDLHRGDVSIVNMGANPHTSVALRAAAKPVQITDLDVAHRSL